MRNPRNRHHGCQNQSDREQQDRAQVSPEIAPRSIQGRGVKQQREEEVKYNVGIEFYLRQARHETERETADNEHDRIRQTQLSRDDHERRDEREQQNDGFGLVHRKEQLSRC